MGNIRCDRDGRVWLITIDRAPVMNSLDFAANDELVEVWRDFERNDEAYVAVITGVGDKAFCAGADLKSYTVNFATRPAPEFRTRHTNGLGLAGITRGMEINRPTGTLFQAASRSLSPATCGSAHRMRNSLCKTPSGAFIPATEGSSDCRRSSGWGTPWK